MLVDLVDAGVGRAQFNHLRADLCDETAVAGATGGGQLGGDAGFGQDGLLHCRDEVARRGQKGLAAQRPLQVVFEAVAVQQAVYALLEPFGRGFGGEAEIEVHHHLARDHIAGAGAAVHVTDLPAGGRKEGVAPVPLGGSHFGQRRQGLVDGVARQLRVGDVALDAAHGELAAERAATAVLDHVARLFDRCGFAHDAVVQRFATGFELLHHHFGAVNRRAFLVAGQQEGDGNLRVWVSGQKFFHRHDERGDGGFHVTGAAAKELAVLVRGRERVTAPLRQRAGGYHVGVPGKYYCFNSCLRLLRMGYRPF